MVHEALALDNDITRVPVQTDRGNHVMFVADPMVKPVDMEKVPVKVLCRVDNIRYFHDMPDQGAHLTRAYQVCVDQLVKQRAAAANIHVPPGVSGSGRA